MTDTQARSLPQSSGWDTYWRGMQGNPAHAAGGTREPVLEDFWQGLFGERIPAAGCSVLELACGSGAVAAIAAKTRPRARLFCSDISPSALALARASLPAATFAASHGRQLPFPDQAFDLVVSQFGIEYAGLEALPEAARTVAPGGCLAVVLHLREGGIYRDYSRNREVIQALRDTGITGRAGEAFAAGFDLVEGRGTEAQFHAAEGRFKSAVRALESLFGQYGTSVADGLPGQIYQDIAHMYPRLRAYQRQDISNWLGAIGAELDAYEGRLSSMLASALGEVEVNDFIADCELKGLQLRRREQLLLGAPASPSGWILVLQRQCRLR
ncbi:methyltransferase domain-containing protein [Seongchinamella sediminis]|uniref:Methyltransferase domain-containing protein n=1 Tax=Seongchinamella sediminis TaxID=2283635 RepID=A0A3L7DY86_9GAMM|nr:class I SAM-dependent methyltransferase [Seongchinamella sediminis]RLQ22156.1 methyltransferase domain-containing protein [Seongchinamella sediminis]